MSSAQDLVSIATSSSFLDCASCAMHFLPRYDQLLLKFSWNRAPIIYFMMLFCMSWCSKERAGIILGIFFSVCCQNKVKPVRKSQVSLKNYTFLGEDKVLIRKTFNRVGSQRLSDSLGKAKKAFSRTKKIPKWIAQVHWGCLMQYWNSEDFKKISAINSKNRMSSNNGEGPSLHTGGSVAFAEYRRRHKELTSEDLRSDELFLKTHKTKNEKKWICGKSERIWNTFTNTIKEKVGETSTLRNEEGLEVDDGDIERNTTTNGEEEGGENSEDNDVTLLKTIPEEQLLNTWIQTVGGTKKGKIYGLGPRNCLLADSSNTDCASSSAPTPSNVPTQQMFETPEFQQLLDRVLEQRMANMQEHMEVGIRENMKAEVNITVRAAVARILGFTPQPPTNGSGSPQNIS